MRLKLHISDVSPPARAAMMTATALGLDVELIQVDLLAKDHLKPEYIKKNPQHTVPMLEDGDFVVWDSHAIAAYLVGKYGKDESMYPKDLQKRAIVDQRLHFDSGVLFSKLRQLALSIIFGTSKTQQEDIDLIETNYGFLEVFLQGNTFLTGEQLTIADLCIVPTMEGLDYLVPVDSKRFPRLSDWMKRMQKLPCYQHLNVTDNDLLKQTFLNKIKENASK